MTAGALGKPGRLMERSAGQQRPVLIARARQDLSGGQTDAEDDAVAGIARCWFGYEFGRCPDGPQCVVLASGRETEDGSHAVLVDAVDDPAMSLDRPANHLFGTSSERLEDRRV
jgi:hypothetical protein